MDPLSRWLQSVPKALFVTIVLAVGIILIVISNPPVNYCDAQVAEFKTATAAIFTISSNDKFQTQTRFQRWISACRSTQDPGGCFPLFAGMRQILRAKKTVSPSCFDQLGAESTFSQAIWQTIDLMAKMAWGSKPPVTSAGNAGFLDAADLSLYCRLQRTAIDVYGHNTWNNFLQRYFSSLPGASQLSRNDAWSRMLFSVNCSTY